MDSLQPFTPSHNEHFVSRHSPRHSQSAYNLRTFTSERPQTQSAFDLRALKCEVPHTNTPTLPQRPQHCHQSAYDLRAFTSEQRPQTQTQPRIEIPSRPKSARAAAVATRMRSVSGHS